MRDAFGACSRRAHGNWHEQQNTAANCCLIANSGREAPARFALPALIDCAHTQMAVLRAVDDGGGNRRYGRLLFSRQLRHTLVEVNAKARVYVWRRGFQFEEDLVRLDDHHSMMPSPILWSACGRWP
jgi:hypothetical protein